MEGQDVKTAVRESHRGPRESKGSTKWRYNHQLKKK